MTAAEIEEVICSAVKNFQESNAAPSDNVTPVAEKRDRRPAAILQSPFLSSFPTVESSISVKEQRVKEIIKGSSPLDNFFDKEFDDGSLREFQGWLLENKLKRSKKAIYSARDNILSPAFDFAIADVVEKEWFYALCMPGLLITSLHVDIIFYYLRKKGKYNRSLGLKFTTTDNFFDQKLQSMYERYMESKRRISVLQEEPVILEYIIGHYLYCNKPWIECDYLLFPIHVSSTSHWVLGILNFAECCLYVYNSLRTAPMVSSVKEIIRAYNSLLPLYLSMVGFFDLRDDLPIKPGRKAFKVVMVQNLPSQNGCDCGVFMCYFAEYFIHGKEIPLDFDVPIHRQRLGFLLYKHEKSKQEEGPESDSEDSGRFDINVMVQPREN